MCCTDKARTILVLQRGWVVVGHLVQDDAEKVRLEGASVIRQWGTTRGLGQLALEGPTKQTQLDPCGFVETHPVAIVLRMPCSSEGKW